MEMPAQMLPSNAFQLVQDNVRELDELARRAPIVRDSCRAVDVTDELPPDVPAVVAKRTMGD
jgi:hypothetical protein